MQRWLRTMNLMAALGAAVLTEAAVGGVQGNGWYATFEDAERAAVREQKPLLIHFHAPWCGPCRQMESQVFQQRDVQYTLQQGIVAVQIDVTREPEIAARYQASTVPRDVVVFPDGLSETINVGYVGRSGYISLLQNVEVRGQRHRPVVRPGVQPETSPLETISPAESAVQMAVEQTEPLQGLEGFCPVALLKDREWVAGREDLTEQYRGVSYQFSTAERLREFQKNPAKFAPQNLGCDPVALLDSQRAIIGKIQYGAFFDNQLYLFYSDENKQEFKKNPLKFTRIRHAVRVQNIEGTQIQ